MARALAGRMLRRGGAALAARLRRETPGSLFWSVYYTANFGDWIGPYLYHRLTDREPLFRRPSSLSRGTVYMSAGSILALARRNSIVWGSGVLRREDSFPEPWRTTAVRGPLSRAAYQRQGYRCPETYGDPAILLPRVLKPPPTPPRYSLGIVPHFRDLPKIMAHELGRSDVKVIDVRRSVELVVRDICDCRCIASSSLHGIITAHSYGIPAVWAQWSHVSGDGTKYHDYFLSADVEPYLPLGTWPAGGSRIDRIIERARASTLPDLTALRESLARTCPFPTDEGIRAQ